MTPESDVAAEAGLDAPRPTDDIVDVLIIGSGASGVAVAWNLAETGIKILCLEQGDWIKHAEFPSNGRDWEARRYADFDISPNRRARDTDYPITTTPQSGSSTSMALAAARFSTPRIIRACIHPTSA